MLVFGVIHRPFHVGMVRARAGYALHFLFSFFFNNLEIHVGPLKPGLHTMCCQWHICLIFI
jgi:hypothetical protein